MNKKTLGLALLVTGGVLAVGAFINMNATKFPTKLTEKIPVFPTGKNAYNVGIGVALGVAGYWLKR